MGEAEAKPLLARQETEPSSIQYYYPSISYQTTAAVSEDNSVSLPELAVYKKRWWIIFVFSVCSLAQSAQWNTWSPISDAVEIAFSWKDSFVTIIPAVSNAAFIFMAFPTMYIIETQGLRIGMFFSILLIITTMAFWNIALAVNANWLVIIGALFNGVAATVTMAAPPLLSVTWFPLHERTTATAIAAGSGYIGTGLGFLAGPYISGANVTADDVKNAANLTEDTGVALFCFLCVLISYPAKPEKPPTRSADIEREDFWHGVADLARNKQFVLMVIAFNLPNGSFNSWLPLVSVNFRSLGVSEATAAWIGFASIMAGCVGSIALSMFVDHFKRRMKLFLVVMCAVSTVAFSLLVCIQEQYIPVPQADITSVLYVLSIVISISLNGVIPLYYELGCEITYPVHEGLTCSFITVANNLFGMIFFLVFLNPTLASNTQWMTWFASATCVASLPMLLLLKERFRRLDIEGVDN